MVEWAAANVKETSSGPTEDGSNQANKRRKTSETPEAALARLTSSYTDAMTSVGKLHKRINLYVKQQSSTSDSSAMDIDNHEQDTNSNEMDLIVQLASDTRKRFENLLSDPLLQKFCPTFHHTWKHYDSDPKIPTCLSSSAHENTLKELAYASLLNYADLLISCCGCNLCDKSIIDRGVVSKIKVVKILKIGCLWSTFENNEDTSRLAMASYCDACDLDGSDPLIWLKLAHAARKVGLILDKMKKSDEDTSINQNLNWNLHRIERFAIERGLTCLEKGMPQNRVMLRAFHELEQMQHIVCDDNDFVQAPYDSKVDSAELFINLKRSSWTTIGRLLLRACREGDTSKKHDGFEITTSWTHSLYRGNVFASPSVRVKICPLLLLEGKELMLICSYLGKESNVLEATCRSISSDLVAARIRAEKDRNKDLKRIEQKMGDALEQSKNSTQPKSVSDEQSKHELLKFAHRTSKRVRSQQMSSDKQAERSAKRKNIEYCLVSSLFPCTIDHPSYNHSLSKTIDWNSLSILHPYNNNMATTEHLQEEPIANNDLIKFKVNIDNGKEKLNQKFQCGDSSLSTFVERFSANNSGSREVLQRFLEHISCYVADVYFNENGNTMLFSQCILETFEMLTKTVDNNLSPRWYGNENCFNDITTSKNTIIETFAVNLLATELMMKSCERHGIKVHSFQDHCHIISTNIPRLLKFAEVIETYDLSDQVKNITNGMILRSNWLASYYYVWYSKHISKLSDIKGAQTKALSFLDKTITFMTQCGIQSLSTPHLVSPYRSGDYWTELSRNGVINYRNQLESSTVIARVRQKFQDCITDCQTPEDLKVRLTSDSVMNSIESDLHERYKLDCLQPQENVDELISDFIGKYRDILSRRVANSPVTKIAPADIWNKMWDAFPSSCDCIHSQEMMKDPSLLSILAICMQNQQVNFSVSMIRLLQKLIETVFVTRITILNTRKSSMTSFVYTNDSDSDDEESDSDSDSDQDSVDPVTLKMLSTFLLHKLTDVISNAKPEEIAEIQHYILDIAKLGFEHSCGMLSSESSSTSDTPNLFQRLQSDKDLLMATLTMGAKYLSVIEESDSSKFVTASLFSMLVKCVVQTKKVVNFALKLRETNTLSRSECHPLIMLNAKHMGVCAVELASICSKYGNQYHGKAVKESFLLQHILFVTDENGKQSKDATIILQFTECLTWFWEFVKTSESIDNPSIGPRYPFITNSVHKQAAKHLLVPIASCICAFIGITGHGHHGVLGETFTSMSNSEKRLDNENLNLSEFFDSDESTKVCAFDDVDTTIEKKRLLQCMCKSVQSVAMVFSDHSDKGLSTMESSTLVPFTKGYFLPLIVVRLLSNMADFVLINFGTSIWDEAYPFGFRSSFAQLDLLLLRAYKCLHGFNFNAPHLASKIERDLIIPTNSSTATNALFYFRPESCDAAIKLYRCVIRSVFESKKRIPIEIFDCIRSLFPKDLANKNVQAIEEFLYNPKSNNTFILNSIPEGFPSWILENGEYNSVTKEDESHIMRCKRGIVEYLADSSTLGLGDKQTSEHSAFLEVELAIEKQFNAIIQSLSYDPKNEAKWYRAGECIAIKINHILDCVIPAERKIGNKKIAPAMTSDLMIQQWKAYKNRKMSIEQIKRRQWRQFLKENCQNFSIDLDVYMKHQFCSSKSLQEMEVEINFPANTYSSIQCIGYKFVSALRLIRFRCYQMTLYLSKQKEASLGMESSMYSEYAENFATSEYDSVSFYDTKICDFEVRERSMNALRLFQAALDSLQSSVKNDCYAATWESLFMIGKCYEKVSSTLTKEKFQEAQTREYEQIMKAAMESYRTAHSDAEKNKEEGHSGQGGGSSHGIQELVYRIHATRLKVLIAAIQVPLSELDLSLKEATRICEMCPFEPESIVGINQSRNEKLWSLFVDAIRGIASCRKASPFFHRSQYRHCQALLWAPVFFNPFDYAVGIIPQIPSDVKKSIPNMDFDDFVQSADAVISTLFDKKRSQIAAVWLTTPSSPSPYEKINSSARKFDSLRCKYIHAFIEVQYLMKNTKKLQNLMKWAYSAQRDLPNLYDLTYQKWRLKAKHDSGIESHIKDNILFPPSGIISFTKVRANSTICRILLDRISKEFQVSERTLFIDFYECFKRLNCPVDAPVWKSRQCQKLLSSVSCIVVEALCLAYTKYFCTEDDTYKLCRDWEYKVLLLHKAASEGERLLLKREADADNIRKQKKK